MSRWFGEEPESIEDRRHESKQGQRRNPGGKEIPVLIPETRQRSQRGKLESSKKNVGNGIEQSQTSFNIAIHGQAPGLRYAKDREKIDCQWGKPIQHQYGRDEKQWEGRGQIPNASIEL